MPVPGERGWGRRKEKLLVSINKNSFQHYLGITEGYTYLQCEVLTDVHV
jgi:hypothetical protein